MQLKPIDEERLKKYYNQALSKNGPASVRSLHWVQKEHQIIRFEILSKIGNLNNCTVLDAGCGLGDLFFFLTKQYKQVNYTGIDILPEMIEAAKNKYPAAEFMNLGIHNLKNKYDYILASGALSFALTEGKSHYYNLIQTMFKMSNKGVAFNVLNADYVKCNETFFSYSKKEISSVCEKLTPHFRIVSGYELADFSVYMYKNNPK
ncbi:MAG: class I SAM-dependent methyltransferase [Candidatus Doudnabacteria bacterium]|nr:class I SAM-dependent methyltransferase [Candidatus Doudnabacteria bacterium]